MKTLTYLLIILSLASCAAYKIYPERNSTEEGLRFRKSNPFLLAVQDKDGNVQYQVIYLPDTVTYVIKKKGFLGSAELSAALENGWNLTSINSKSDPQVAETITALASLIPALKGSPADSVAMKEAFRKNECPPVCLYKYNPATNALIQVNYGASPGRK